MTDMHSTDPTHSREMLAATREVLETEISRLAELIGASSYQLVSFNPYVDAGCPYIEIDEDGQLHWIVKERGQLLEHRTTRDPDELLYWAFQSTTFDLASHWEAQHRDDSKDFRVGLWARQAELLHRLNPLRAQRWRRNLAACQPGDNDLMPDLPPHRAGGTCV